MSEPNPTEVAPWYLRNITQALALDEASGNVYVRTGFEGNIIISGNVNIPGNIDAHISEIGTSGNLTVPWMPVSIDGNSNVTISGGNVNAAVTGTVTATLSGNLAGITGNVNIGTMPNVNAAVSGNVGITGGNVNAAVTGTVTVSSITSNVTVVDGGGSLTIDGNVGITGNVNIGTMPNVNASVTGNVGVSSLGNIDISGNTLPVSGNVSVTGTANVALGGTNLDAFGRLRVSNPVTLFDTNNLYLPGGQFSNVNATGGTYTYVQAESSFNMAVTSASGSSVITQALYTQAYQPGKSLLSLNSFCFGTLKANCRQRVGYFTANNGIYFEADGTTLNLVIRSSASGVLVEDRIPQSSWNGNPLNGAGPSNITLNPALTNIFWCDIEWLGVGNVRAGFVINGQFIVCHTFEHANIPGNTKVYMTTAVLNPRYEITNTGATSGSTTMKQICSTVISEGGYTPTPLFNYVSNETTTTRVSSANTVTALCAVRVNPAYPDAVVKPSQIDLLTTDVRYGQLKLVINPSITVGSWSNVANSCMQTAIISNVITDGTTVYAATVSSRNDIAITDGPGFGAIQLGRTVSGNTDVMVFAVAWTAPNTDLLWKLAWSEYTNN